MLPYIVYIDRIYRICSQTKIRFAVRFCFTRYVSGRVAQSKDCPRVVGGDTVREGVENEFVRKRYCKFVGTINKVGAMPQLFIAGKSQNR